MSRENNFDPNLYAAFIEGKTTNEQTRMVLKRILRSQKLAMLLNSAAFICYMNENKPSKMVNLR